MTFLKCWTFSGNLRNLLQNFLTLLLKKLDFFHRNFRRHCMIFRQKSDSFYTLFKLIDVFLKVLDFFTISFTIYSKKFGGIQNFCIRFSQKLHHIQQKIRLSGQILRQIFESIWPFSQIQKATTKKMELIHHIIGRQLHVFPTIFW